MSYFATCSREYTHASAVIRLRLKGPPRVYIYTYISARAKLVIAALQSLERGASWKRKRANTARTHTHTRAADIYSDSSRVVEKERRESRAAAAAAIFIPVTSASFSCRKFGRRDISSARHRRGALYIRARPDRAAEILHDSFLQPHILRPAALQPPPVLALCCARAAAALLELRSLHTLAHTRAVCDILSRVNFSKFDFRELRFSRAYHLGVG